MDHVNATIHKIFRGHAYRETSARAYTQTAVYRAIVLRVIRAWDTTFLYKEEKIRAHYLTQLSRAENRTILNSAVRMYNSHARVHQVRRI